MWSTLLDRGRQTLVIWPVIRVENSRGTVEFAPDLENPRRIRVTTTNDQSRIATLQGQIDIDVIRVKSRSYPTRAGGTWSRCELNGIEYDLAEPPYFTAGTSRATSHWTYVLRSRSNLEPTNPGPIEDIPFVERRTS